MKGLHIIAIILLWIGGLNWLLSVWDWDLANWADASGWMTFLKIVYVVVGLAAIYDIFTHRKGCRMCTPGGGAPGM